VRRPLRRAVPASFLLLGGVRPQSRLTYYVSSAPAAMVFSNGAPRAMGGVGVPTKDERNGESSAWYHKGRPPRIAYVRAVGAEEAAVFPSSSGSSFTTRSLPRIDQASKSRWRFARENIRTRKWVPTTLAVVFLGMPTTIYFPRSGSKLRVARASFPPALTKFSRRTQREGRPKGSFTRPSLASTERPSATGPAITGYKETRSRSTTFFSW